MRVRNGQQSRFGDLTAPSDPRAIPTRQIYKPRLARNNIYIALVIRLSAKRFTLLKK